MENIFNKEQFFKNRDRYSNRNQNYNFLLQETASLMLERLDVIKPKFPTVLEIGSGFGDLSYSLSGRNGIEKLYMLDFSAKMLEQSNYPSDIKVEKTSKMDFKKASIDMVLSNFFMFCENNPQELFKNIYNILKKDGLFFATIPCFGTLDNVANALFDAEIDLRGGVSPRIHPFPDIRDVGNTLVQAGFYAPIVDSYNLEIHYKNPMNIFKDLKYMGFANVLNSRSKAFASKELFSKACNILEKDASIDDGIKVIYNVCFITAWKD